MSEAYEEELTDRLHSIHATAGREPPVTATTPSRHRRSDSSSARCDRRVVIPAPPFVFPNEVREQRKRDPPVACSVLGATRRQGAGNRFQRASAALGISPASRRYLPVQGRLIKPQGHHRL